MTLGCCADPVKLLPLPARHLFGLVIWYRSLRAFCGILVTLTATVIVYTEMDQDIEQSDSKELQSSSNDSKESQSTKDNSKGLQSTNDDSKEFQSTYDDSKGLQYTHNECVRQLLLRIKGSKKSLRNWYETIADFFVHYQH